LPVWRRDGDNAHTLRITRRGRQAIRVDEETAAAGELPKKPPARSAKSRQSGHASGHSIMRTGSKQANVIAMLSRAHGVTIAGNPAEALTHIIQHGSSINFYGPPSSPNRLGIANWSGTDRVWVPQWQTFANIRRCNNECRYGANVVGL
jgi:hypothetical protein